MTIDVQLEPMDDGVRPVAFRWDADTDILSARIAPAGGEDTAAGAVQLEGSDGSWISLETRSGALVGVEVVVWPEVRVRSGLLPPAVGGANRALFPSTSLPGGDGGGARGGVVELETAVLAEADGAEEVIYFRVGRNPPARAVCVGRDLLVEVDRSHRLAGIWLLNVPPFPSTAQAP